MSARHWARVLGACVVAGCLLASPASHAQDDPTTTAAARERFKEGVAHFDRKEYEKARAAFLQAYALKKHPAVLLNLAQSEVRSGHERDAAKHFTQYLREATDASPAERESAQAGLATARAAVVELEVNIDEAGAEILVNGTSEGIAPLADPVFLEPGSHSVEAKKGELRGTQTVSGKAGEKKQIRLTLGAAAPAAPAPAPATSDKAEAQEEPVAEAEVSTGGRMPFFSWVTSRPAGFIPAGATVLLGLGAGAFAVGANASYGDADATAEDIQTAATKDAISTQGICVDTQAKLAGTPRYDGIDANGNPDNAELANRVDRADQYATACGKHQDSIDQGDTFKSVAIGLGVGAGVAAVATVVLYFTTAPKTGETAKGSSPPPSVAVVPWATTDSGGIAVFGAF